jgi:predicted  nucleic acid-binding Zn-ribbon protein
MTQAMSEEMDCRCMCETCESRTKETYRLAYLCPNCGRKGTGLYRKGDKPSWSRECPNCGVNHLLWTPEDRPAEPPASMREAFEKWWRAPSASVAVVGSMDLCWSAWQAALASRPTSEPVGVREAEVLRLTWACAVSDKTLAETKAYVREQMAQPDTKSPDKETLVALLFDCQSGYASCRYTADRVMELFAAWNRRSPTGGQEAEVRSVVYGLFDLLKRDGYFVDDWRENFDAAMTQEGGK